MGCTHPTVTGAVRTETICFPSRPHPRLAQKEANAQLIHIANKDRKEISWEKVKEMAAGGPVPQATHQAAVDPLDHPAVEKGSNSIGGENKVLVTLPIHFKR